MRCMPEATDGGRLDLDDEVDRPHVDAELEAARGDEGRQPARLEVLLDLEPLLARDAAVMRPHELLAGELVQARRQPLGEPPAVHEDERGPMRPDELEQRGMDRRPDRVARLGPAAGPPGASSTSIASPIRAMSSTGTMISRSSSLRAPASTISTSRPVPPRKAPMADERPLRRRQADSLRVAIGQVAEPLEREREVRSALRPGDRMDLVDDHVLDAAEDLARLAGQQQVERLGGGDEDVGRVRTSARRASAGVSPVRLPTLISGTDCPRFSAVRRMPASGVRRLRSTSYVSAFSGLT